MPRRVISVCIGREEGTEEIRPLLLVLSLRWLYIDVTKVLQGFYGDLIFKSYDKKRDVFRPIYEGVISVKVKSVGLAVSALAMTALVAGCGTQAATSANTSSSAATNTTSNKTATNSSNTTSSTSTSGVTDITFWVGHPSGALHKAILAEVKHFNDTHPTIHVDVKIVHVTNKGIPAFIAHKAPNVGEIETASIKKFINAGAVVNLAPYVSGSNGLSASQIKELYYPSVWKDMQGPGSAQYLMPLEKKSAVVIYYNETLFKKAGIHSAPQTWNQVFDDIQKITALGGKIHGWAWTPLLREFFVMVKDYGGHIYKNSSHTKFDMDSPQAEQVLTKLRSLVAAGDVIVGKKYEYQQDFGTGDIGLLVDASAGWTYDYGSVGGKFPMLATPAPRGTAPIPYNWINGGSLIMFNTGTTAQKNAAWTFMKWMSSPNNNAYWNEHTNYLPLGPAADAKMASFYKTNKAYAASFSDPAGWIMKPRSNRYSEAQTAMTNYFLEALNGQMPVTQALQMMDKVGDKYMSGNERL